MPKRFASRSSSFLPDTLPSLQGAWLKSYTALWAALAAIAVLMTGLNAWKGLEPFEYTWAHYGLTTTAGSGDRVHFVTGSEATAKGFKTGDVILAIDGVPMEEIGTGYLAFRKALIRKEGETVAFTVRTAAGTIATKRLTRLEENTRGQEASRKLNLGLQLAAALAFLCAAILLFRRRREPVPAILALAFTMVLATPTAAAEVWLDRAALTAVLEAVGTIGPALFLFSLVAFPDGRMSRAAWAIACVILVWSLIPILFPASVAADMKDLIGPALLAAATIRLIVRYRRLPDGIPRQQVRWSIFGFVLGALLIAVATGLGFVARQVGGPTTSILLNVGNVAVSLSLGCIAAGLVISLMRYRLYDADTVIGRSAAYGVLTLGFLALFAGSQEVIGALGETYFGNQLGALAGGIGAAIAAVLMVPMHTRANDWAERRFQKELVRLRRELPRLVSDLRETEAAPHIAQAVAERAVAGVKANHAAVLMGNEVIGAAGVAPDAVNDWLKQTEIEDTNAESASADRLFPHRLALDFEGVGRVGWLVLGPHPDGSRLGKDERDTLAEIAEPVARALAIAQSRDFERREIGAFLKGFEERLRALEDVVVPRTD
jgi:hypothetical protein